MEDFSTNSTTPKYKQYNPYQHIDPNTPYTKLYNIPTSPELLFDDGTINTRRNFSENVTFITGTSFLCGAVFGTLKGTLNGLSQAEYGDSLKLRVNRVLNTGGLMGRRYGNSVGIMGLIYAGLFSLVGEIRGDDGVVGCGLAGMGTGAVYRIPAGLRGMAVASVVGGAGVGAFVYGKEVLQKYMQI